MPRLRLVKLVVVAAFAAAAAAALVTNNFITRTSYAYSSGPPPGHTRAPGEPTCAECHLPEDGVPTGSISISAPQTYIPGQTYQITVTVSNAHTSRRRWGFQLTAVDDTGNRAGTLAAGMDGRTQVIAGTLGTPARQYVEHTSDGTSQGNSAARRGRSTGLRPPSRSAQSSSTRPATRPTTTATLRATASTSPSPPRSPPRRTATSP